LHGNDHDEYYPLAGGEIGWGVIDGSTGKPSWMQQLDYYVQAERPVFDGCANYPVPTPFHYFMGANAAYMEAGGTFAAVKRTKIKLTSAFILAGDNNKQFDEPDADKDDYTQECLFGQRPGWWPHHDGGLNILFADSHAEYA